MSEVEAVAAEAAPAPVTIVETPVQTVEQTMGDVYDKLNPDTRVGRSDNGQFKSKEAAVETAPVAEGAETSDTAEITQEPAEEKVEPEKTPAIDVPPSWTTEAKEKWSSLSPEVQKYIADRESQVQSRLSELGRAVKATEAVKPYLEPLERIAAQKGLTSGDALQRLLAADEFLSRDPEAAIKWLANAYHLDMSRLAPQPQLAGDTPESAQVNALTQELNGLKRQLAETSHRITARETAEMQAREQTLAQSVEKFAKDKDYWPDIEDEVYHQILALKSADPQKVLADPMNALKEAEDRAIKLKPEVKAKLEKAQREKDEATKKAEAKRKADDAKRLSTLNVKSSTGASPKASPKNMADEMAQIYDRLQATG